MAFVPASDRARIVQAIKDVERRTSGEIVTVVAARASDYRFIALSWGAGLALAVPACVLLAWPAMPASALYLYQLAVFAAVEIVLLYRPLRLLLVPRSVKERRARQLAYTQFYAQGVHLTAGHTGILLFVAVAERHVEILADGGIDAKVGPDTWRGIVDRFVAAVRAGRVADGFVAAIAELGAPLARHFPAVKGDADELPDRFIEL